MEADGYSRCETTRLRFAGSDLDSLGLPGSRGRTKGWTHANSVSYHAGTDLVLVSLRYQEAVISISRKTGELNWILGTHEDWGEPWA